MTSAWPAGALPRTTVAALLLALAACSPAEGRSEEYRRLAEHVPVHVDSVFPIEEELRRFQASLPYLPERLDGGAESRAELVERFLTALERLDTAELATLRLSREEFGALYYPASRYTSPPYELAPSLVWFQLEARSARGVSRALQRYGGRGLGFAGHRCHPDPVLEGGNRLWTGCALLTEEAAPPLALFGPILEREGRFKFLSYVNGL